MGKNNRPPTDISEIATVLSRRGVTIVARKDLDDMIKKAVETGRMMGDARTKDIYKETERRLYAYPIILEKIADDKERIKEIKDKGMREKSKSIVRFQANGVRLTKEEIIDAAVQDLEAKVAANEHEIEELDKSLILIKADTYYRTVSGRYMDQLTDIEVGEEISCDTTTVWRNRKRLIQRIAVRLYGVEAVK